MANTHVYTRKEEIVNAITHGVGVLLSIAALVFLIIYSAKQDFCMVCCISDHLWCVHATFICIFDIGA